MESTENSARIRGYVGRHIRLPRNDNEFLVFDVMTKETIASPSGELISIVDWHTVETWDKRELDKIKPGAWIEAVGRMSTWASSGRKKVVILARKVEVLLSQEEREKIRGRSRAPLCVEEGEIEWTVSQGKR